jgi:micrococcal nuclease
LALSGSARKLTLVRVLVAGALAAVGFAAEAGAQQLRPTVNGRAPCTVSRIIDGDTFQCEGGSRVRLLLVDADEAGQSVWADSATVLLERVMPVGARVRLEFDVELTDRYRRLLAYVYAGDVFVNRELARRGLAHVVVIQPNVSRLEEIRAAADSARNARRGLWSGSAYECTPADWRAGRCR